MLYQTQKQECINCGKRFTLQPNHLGFANKCEECNQDTKEVEKLEAEVSWLNKHTPLIRVTDAKSARAFNRRTKRLGAGVSSSIVQSQTGPGEKIQNNSDPGSPYTSKLNEKHSLKR